MTDTSTEAHPTVSHGLIGDSARIAVASGASRLTGMLRIVVAASVLGATVLGDLFVAVNVLPLVLYDVFAGSAISSVLVPPLVRYLGLGDRDRASRLAANALGVIVVAMGAVAVLAIAGRGWIAGALTSGVDAPLAADARRVGALLAALILPQLVLYAAIGVLVSIQHAHRRFLLPSAAPILENLGLLTTIGVVLVRFGRGWEVTTAPTAMIITLAVGSGLSVGIHALVQYVGARRALGRRLRPSLGWRHPDVVALVGPTTDSFGWSSVIAVRQFALVVGAGFAGAGGVQAFEIATLAYFVPLALIGRPVASAALPRLAASAASKDDDLLAGYRHAMRLTSRLAVPAALAFVVLARPLAGLAAQGDFADGDATTLLTYGLIGLGIGAGSEALFEVARQTAMACGAGRGLRRSTWIRAITAVVGIPAVIIWLDGAAVLFGLGLVVSIGDLSALAVMHRTLVTATDGRST